MQARLLSQTNRPSLSLVVSRLPRLIGVESLHLLKLLQRVGSKVLLIDEPAQRPRPCARQSTMRADASEAVRAKCIYTATTLQPSSAASSSTVAANIRMASAIKKTIRKGRHRIRSQHHFTASATHSRASWRTPECRSKSGHASAEMNAHYTRHEIETLRSAIGKLSTVRP